MLAALLVRSCSDSPYTYGLEAPIEGAGRCALHTTPNLVTPPKTTHRVAMLLQYLPPQGASPTEHQPP
jgi:hypothetical protein